MALVFIIGVLILAISLYFLGRAHGVRSVADQAIADALEREAELEEIREELSHIRARAREHTP